MFFSADDDEQDFMSPGGSKLASLFGMDKASGQGGNESLTYTAPKQPKKKEPSPEGGTPAVVVAGVVHAYKFVDNKHTSQGKLGVALLSTQATKDYRILLYINRQQQVTNAKLTPTFSFSIQQNNYASFYDDARQSWSIMFESADLVEKFAKEIALAKASMSGSGLTDVIQQDLALGEGGALEAGDSVEAKYTGWLLTGGTFGKVFDQSAADNFYRFKVGKGKVIKGWDQGMLGMKKGGKRLLIIPPSLGYGSQAVGDRIPPDATLIFEVQVMRVKLQKGDSPQETPAPASSAATPASSSTTASDQEEVEEAGVKGRTRSINEHMSHSPDSNKAKLISRMAKMGQPMLPFQGAIPAQPDDSDEEHPAEQAVPSSPKPSLPRKPKLGGAAGGQASQVIITQAPPTVMQPGVAMVGDQPVLVQQQQQQYPAFLQNLPGAQQLAVYQNPNILLQQQQQQQQQALLQQQQQQLLQQQQQQQQQQQYLGQTITSTVGSMPGHMSGYGVLTPSTVAPPMVHPHLPPHLAAVPPPPPPAPPTSVATSSSDSLAPVLLTETRHQNTEVRLGLSKVSDKVDKILEKIDHLNSSVIGHGPHSMGMMAPYGSMPAPSMEANVLMQNITRIVQENERLKKEVYEQSNKVQEQNEKIANLLEKNQKYVEQSQNLLEQRNEGYKHTASQSQARVLALEQEKVHLTTELSTASAHISSLQLELGELRKKEGELKQQLQNSSSSNTSTKDELNLLRIQKQEDEEKIANLSSSIRNEKHARKSLESKLASFEEELADLRAAKETLEKNLSERKRKANEDRAKLEQDIEDAKTKYEETMENLREKLRKQKIFVNTEADSKLSKIEEEISSQWQAKADSMMAAAEEKHNAHIREMASENEELESKVTELQNKLANVRSQAASMKERYEERIEEMESDKEDILKSKNQVVERARQQVQELQEKLVKFEKQPQVQQAVGNPVNSQGGDHAVVTAEVKKIMNSVFQSLRGEFDAEENYTGSEVLATVLQVIKQTTLKLLTKAQDTKAEVEANEEEGSEEEDNEHETEEEEERSGEESKQNDEEAESSEDTQTTQTVSEASKDKDGTASAPGSSSAQTETATSTAATDGTSAIEPSLSTVNESSSAANASVSAEAPSSVTAASASENTTQDNVQESEDTHSKTENDTSVTESSAKSVGTERNEPGGGGAHGNEKATESSQAREDGSLAESKSEAVSESAMDNIRDGEPIGSEKNEPPPVLPEPQKAAPENIVPVPAAAAVSREPPPLVDDDIDDDDDDESPLFGEDSTVSDTLGTDFKPKPVPESPPATQKGKPTPGKKVAENQDEDLRPQPPPPLFGDDSDDDDLDWLS